MGEMLGLKLTTSLAGTLVAVMTMVIIFVVEQEEIDIRNATSVPAIKIGLSLILSRIPLIMNIQLFANSIFALIRLMCNEEFKKDRPQPEGGPAEKKKTPYPCEKEVCSFSY